MSMKDAGHRGLVVGTLSKAAGPNDHQIAGQIPRIAGFQCNKQLPGSSPPQKSADSPRTRRVASVAERAAWQSDALRLGFPESDRAPQTRRPAFGFLGSGGDCQEERLLKGWDCGGSFGTRTLLWDPRNAQLGRSQFCNSISDRTGARIESNYSYPLTCSRISRLGVDVGGSSQCLEATHLIQKHRLHSA